MKIIHRIIIALTVCATMEACAPREGRTYVRRRRASNHRRRQPRLHKGYRRHQPSRHCRGKRRQRLPHLGRQHRRDCSHDGSPPNTASTSCRVYGFRRRPRSMPTRSSRRRCAPSAARLPSGSGRPQPADMGHRERGRAQRQQRPRGVSFINELSKIIKSVDKRHLTATVIAHNGSASTLSRATLRRSTWSA